MKRNKVMDWLAYIGLRVIIALIQSTSLENCQRAVRVAACGLAHWLPP